MEVNSKGKQRAGRKEEWAQGGARLFLGSCKQTLNLADPALSALLSTLKESHKSLEASGFHLVFRYFGENFEPAGSPWGSLAFTHPHNSYLPLTASP